VLTSCTITTYLTFLGAIGAVMVSTAAAPVPQGRPADLPVVRLEGGVAGQVTGGQQPPARPGGLEPLPVTQLDERAGAAGLDGPRTVSLAAPRPLPIRDVLRLLVTGTSFGVVVDDEVEGTFEGDLKNMSLRKALEAVLFPRALEYEVEGTLIRVFPRRTRTRLFDVNFLNVRRSWQRGVRSAIGVSGSPDSTDLRSSLESDALDEMARGVNVLLSPSGRAHIDRKAGIVQVTDFADHLDQVGVYVEAVQVRASRQVRLQARVFEITLKDAAATTIDWDAVAARLGAGLRGSAATAGMRIADLDAFMRAIAEQGDVRTIAAPQVLAMNNEPAVMRAGTQGVYFVAASQLDENGRPRERTHRAESVLEGLTLTVTPQVAADGIVQLSVAPSYAEKTGQVKSAGGGTAPILSIAESDSIMRVHDGETIVISGLLQDRTRAKPATGFAGIFGGQPTERVKSELVVLLTPTVVTPGMPGPSASR
jgi:MSHA biogenesis protein MshL